MRRQASVNELEAMRGLIDEHKGIASQGSTHHVYLERALAHIDFLEGEQSELLAAIEGLWSTDNDYGLDQALTHLDTVVERIKTEIMEKEKMVK